eukprot:1561194-Prymnesium_polylepis.1
MLSGHPSRGGSLRQSASCARPLDERPAGILRTAKRPGGAGRQGRGSGGAGSANSATAARNRSRSRMSVVPPAAFPSCTSARALCVSPWSTSPRAKKACDRCVRK